MSAGEIVGLIGALAALLSAVAGLVALGSTARRLRHDLAQDVQILPHLHSITEADLRADIHRRSHLLVASSRCPIVTLYDVSLVGIVSAYPVHLVVLGIILPGEIDMFTLGFAFVLLVSGLASLAKFTREWTLRAANRIVYLYGALGDEAAKAAAKSQTLAYAGVPLFLFFSYLLPAVPLLEVVRQMQVASWVFSLGSVCFFLGAAAASIVAAFCGRELHDILGYYSPIAWIHDKYAPRIRPEILTNDPEKE